MSETEISSGKFARHRVDDRPNHIETRRQKRRHKRFGVIREPRAKLKHELAKRVTQIDLPFMGPTNARLRRVEVVVTIRQVQSN